MKLFLAGTSLHPSYGGPAYSVARLAVALAAAEVEAGLWTPDQSVAASALLPDGSRVRRLTGSIRDALDSFGPPDVLHDNGLWRSHNHRLAAVARAQRIPRIVSTRGMLEPWALHHKRWKKRIAWPLYQRRDLLSASCLHATSEAEAENLRQLELNVPIRVIPNGVDIPEAGSRPADTGIRTALFLGRLYPVKGLPMLIEAWSHVRPAGWRLTIAGPDEGGHRRELEKHVAAAGVGGAVSFAGPLDAGAKGLQLLEADLFVLPSHSESFGMAVAEALAHGLPVLTTTAVPWPTLETYDCGWRVAPTPDGLAEGLRHATSRDPNTLARMGTNGRALVRSAFQWETLAQRYVAMYQEMSR